MDNYAKPYISGLIVTLVSIAFFPAGIFLVFVRMAKHRHYTHLRIKDRRLLRNLTFVLFLFFLPLAISLATVENNMVLAIITLLVTLLPCLYLHARAVTIEKELDKRTKHYHQFIYDQRLETISGLAGLVSVKPAVALQELRYMEAKGLLPNVHIDPLSDRVRIHQPRPAAASAATAKAQTASARQTPAQTAPPQQQRKAAPPPKTVACKSCGASTVLQFGEHKPCEYCETILHYT